VLRQFDAVQDGVHTLSAEFTETTESSLLTEAIVAQGRVFLTKPDSVRWEYTKPEEMAFVIRENEYTGYFPRRKQAERRDIHRWREQLFRFLGLGQASTELAKFYDIALGADGEQRPGTYLLVLDPKKNRVRKRMDAVRFWIDAKTYLPVRVEYRAKSGNRRVIDFDRMAVNPELAANLYRMEIPEGVVITNGFSALSGFSTVND
jgi:outer membrane lipoprotein-sorting protein